MSEQDRRPHRPRQVPSWLAIVLVLLGACSSTTAPATDARSARGRSSVTPATPGQAASAEYRLGVGDVLRVALWKDADLDVTAPIAPDGRIALPLIGGVVAAGRTVEELRVELTRLYTAYVNAPAVLVVLQQINSRKVYVMGEVAQPGAYDLTDGMRLMHAIALAGGLTPYAGPGGVVILRSDGARQVRYSVDLRRIIAGNSTDNLALWPGDTVVVPAR